MQNWPRVATQGIALLPVAAFVFIVASVVVQTIPAIAEVGVGLLGTTFAGPSASLASALYGLVAPVWGTVQVALLALLIAIPGAIALAVLMEELPLGLLTRALSPALGVMAGIPPIIYAILSLVLVEFIMRPKFSASQLEEPIKAAIQGSPVYIGVRLPNALPNSQLLGGLLLAVLVIPLVAPLVADALHGVPAELRLASYALGAGRWHTLTRVVIPAALPGIIAAATLGALKAIGEVTIPYFVVAYGLEIVRLPDPLVDVLTHTQPLTSTGAVLLRGFNTEGSGTGIGLTGLPVAVAYTTALVLLLLAFAIMGLASLVQARLAHGPRR
jgi:phosphate transport system permease protein